FVIGNQTHEVVVPYLVHILLGLRRKYIFFLGDDYIVEPHRQTTGVGHLETEMLDIIQEMSSSCDTADLHHLGNDLLQLLRSEEFVDKTNLFGNKLVEDQPAC